MYEAHESGESFLASQCDPAEAFEFVEEKFDLMAFFVEPPIDCWGNGTAWIGLDLGCCAEIICNEGA